MPDERFAINAPQPDGKLLAIGKRIDPVAARDGRGQDVLAAVLRSDRKQAHAVADPRFLGYAERTTFELDFGDGARREVRVGRALPRARRLGRIPLLAHQPRGVPGRSAARSDVGRGRGQRLGLRPHPERGLLSGRHAADHDVAARQAARRAHGQAPARHEPGALDRPVVPVPAGGREARDAHAPGFERGAAASGFPREYSPDGGAPRLYDYDILDPSFPWKTMGGAYTRFGDVGALLRDADDCYAIFGGGEEIVLTFDPLPRRRPA